MVFHFVDNQGIVYGSIDEISTGIYPIIASHWDEVQLQITFTRQLPDVPSQTTQNYTGYLFTGPEAAQTPTLAGTFTIPNGFVAGWYATYAPGEIPDRLV
jgi:hypothetical protein